MLFRINQFLVCLLCLCLIATTVFADTRTIGALAELSGNFSRLGKDCRVGYQIAQEQSSSGTKIIIGDNQSDPKAGISEYHRLVDSEHASIIVTTRSPVGLALNPISSKQKLPLIGIVGHPRFVSENPFAVRVFPAAIDEAWTLSSYLQKTNETKIAVITIEDEYFLGLKDQFEKLMGKEKIVFSETVLPTEQDFSSIILRIRAKSPDAIFINLGPPQLLQFVKKLKETKISANLYSNFLIGMADLRKALGVSAEGIIFAELDYNQPNFLKAVSEKTGSKETSPIGYGCYVALSYAMAAIEESEKTKNPVSEVINSLSEVKTLDGKIIFAGREAKFKVVLKIIREGLIQQLEF